MSIMVSDRQTRTDLRISDEEVHKVKVKKFSVEEMDEIILMATMKAEAQAELRLVDKD